MRRQLVDARRRPGPMKLRGDAPLARVCAAVILTALALGATAAEKPFKAPRTSDGQPDLQGYWTNNTVVPLQRPAAYADRAQLTEAEARERLDKALEPSETEAGTDADVHYQLTDYGLDITQRKMNLDTRTAAIVGYRAVDSHEYESCARRMPSMTGSGWRVPASSPDSIPSPDGAVKTLVSMPDENARPLPITTSARSSGSSASSRPSVRISCHMRIENALSRSGRLSRSQPTASTRSNSIVS